ncbi:hypothetical protein Chor_005024 [Crotalus horridus]
MGTLAGVIPIPINQVPPSEVTIQPSPVVVTIPGPILSASCEPIAVGGNTPCAPGGLGQIGLPIKAGNIEFRMTLKLSVLGFLETCSGICKGPMFPRSLFSNRGDQ